MAGIPIITTGPQVEGLISPVGPLEEEAERVSLLQIPIEDDSNKLNTRRRRNNLIIKMIIGSSGFLFAIGLIYGGFVVSGKRHAGESSSTPAVRMVYPEVPKKSEHALKQHQKDDFNNAKLLKSTRSSLIDKISYEILGAAKLYDRSFMNEWWKMMRRLWTADGGSNGVKSAMPTSVVDLLPRSSEKPYRVKKLVSQWYSPDCKFLDLNLKHVKTIQDGSSNTVLLMKDTNTHNRYVVKTISNPDAFFNELSFFMFIDPKHPYFSRAVCHRRNKEGDGTSKAKIIFEYVAGVESLEFARKARMSDLKRISAQLFLAIEHMHYLKYIHADLKPQNVLIDLNGNVKVIDFGFASQLPYGKSSQGTHFTMAPELHGKVPGMIHEGIDWWAYGATIAMWFGAYYDEKKYSMAHDGLPSGRTGHKNTCILMNWEKDHFEAGKVPKEFPEHLRSFLYMFHSADPDTRLFNTPRLLNLIRNHEFFADINWSELHGGDFGKKYPVDN